MARWKAIKGYNNQYWISDEGNVMSLKNKGRLLKPNLMNTGYYSVNLCKNGKLQLRLIHRLVAEAFIPNPDNLPCVNHKNEIKTDNRVENLEWCSYSYNNKYNNLEERKAISRSKPVIQYDMQGNFIRKWLSATEVERQMGYFNQNIQTCCQGKRKTAYGFKWKYAA